VESCVLRGGEERVTGGERGPENEGNLSEAVFILLAAPNGEEAGCPERGASASR
jgi:hypothetical protein